MRLDSKNGIGGSKYDMMSLFFAMLAQATTGPWSPPVQARWDGDRTYIDARLASDGKPIPMKGMTALKLQLSADGEALRISPFIAATRGIAFEVTDRNGKIVSPREPMAISPSVPVEPSALLLVTRANPLNVAIGERAINLFPKPGRYRVRAIISLVRMADGTPAYRTLRSNDVTVEVSA